MAIIHAIGQTWKIEREINLNTFWDNNTQNLNNHFIKNIYALKHDPLNSNHVIETWSVKLTIDLLKVFSLSTQWNRGGCNINYHLKLQEVGT